MSFKIVPAVKKKGYDYIVVLIEKTLCNYKHRDDLSEILRKINILRLSQNSSSSLDKSNPAIHIDIDTEAEHMIPSWKPINDNLDKSIKLDTLSDSTTIIVQEFDPSLKLSGEPNAGIKRDRSTSNQSNSNNIKRPRFDAIPFNLDDTN